MTQRPDLFGAALPSVGVLDMLRFHALHDRLGVDVGLRLAGRSGRRSARCWPTRRTTTCATARSIRPTLITTGDHDDRVFPAHSFKFAAALQHAQGGDAPVLLRVETKAGHGAGKPTEKMIDEVADRYAFLAKVFAIV